MKKLIAIVLAVTMLSSISGVALANPPPPPMVYPDDQAGWEAAVGSWVTEDFEDKAVGPGVSVVSTNGQIYEQASLNDLWWDSLTYDGGPTAWTTWTFANPIYSFGGTWDLGSDRTDPIVGGPGSNIEVLMNGSWVNVGVIDNDYIDQFWGFTYTEPFTQVRLQAYNDEGWTERYTLDDMVYSIAPEVEKVWTMTDVCFDPDECDVTHTGTEIDELEALLKNGKIHTVTPGQVYAMSTVTLHMPVASLVIVEDFSNCTEMLQLNPKKGGGKVIVVYWNGVDWEQILDAMDPEVVVVEVAGTATVTLTDVPAGTYLVLVKFKPTLKGEPFTGQQCENINSATIGSFIVSDSATLTVVERVPE